jgi:predicted RNA-binding protein with PUA-like domain
VQVLRKIPTLTLPELRSRPELADMLVLKKGNRLSITPVEARHWKAITGK